MRSGRFRIEKTTIHELSQIKSMIGSSTLLRDQLLIDKMQALSRPTSPLTCSNYCLIAQSGSTSTDSRLHSKASVCSQQLSRRRFEISLGSRSL